MFSLKRFVKVSSCTHFYEVEKRLQPLVFGRMMFFVLFSWLGDLTWDGGPMVLLSKARNRSVGNCGDDLLAGNTPTYGQQTRNQVIRTAIGHTKGTTRDVNER